MSEPSPRRCLPCSMGNQLLTSSEARRRCGELAQGWEFVDEHHLARAYRFRDFGEALAFANRVGAIAEEVQHHPEMHVGWGKVRLELWTHKSNGLTDGDFVLAHEIDRLMEVAE